jgi:hypothetical protein
LFGLWFLFEALYVEQSVRDIVELCGIQMAVKGKSKKELDEELEDVRELMDKVEDLLAFVDASDFSKNSEKRHFPLFDASEIAIGPMLGFGSFGLVLEVEEFLFKDKQDEETTQFDQMAADPDDVARTERAAAAVNETAILTNGFDHDTDEQSHYDVDTARAFMKENVQRNGTGARYAIKVLREDLSDLDRTRGMIDVVIEIKLLSRLWHPNIGKLFVTVCGF